MLNTSPIDFQHRALGAKMGEFGGWDMPISYAGTVSEHTSVRERVGLFDVSHLGKLIVRGSDAATFLDTQLSNRMADLQPGRARYTLILNEDAGIIDDVIVYCTGEDEYLVVPNASNREAVFHRLRSAVVGDVSVEIVELTTFAVQGPRAHDIIEARFPTTKDMGYMHVARDGGAIIARSGYTGERGFEIFTSLEDATDAWDALLSDVQNAGGEPCGLAARDTLRLEMGYPLHGSDIDPEHRPDEAGLMWAVKLKNREFPGARALRESKPRDISLVGLRATDKAIPRHGSVVLNEDETIGDVTSGTFSPTLKVGIALAYVRNGHSSPLVVETRGKRSSFDVVPTPFVDRSPK